MNANYKTAGVVIINRYFIYECARMMRAGVGNYISYFIGEIFSQLMHLRSVGRKKFNDCHSTYRGIDAQTELPVVRIGECGYE